MHSGLTDHRKGVPGCPGTSSLLIMLAGGSILGTGTVHFARTVKGLRVKVPLDEVPRREHVCLCG